MIILRPLVGSQKIIVVATQDGDLIVNGLVEIPLTDRAAQHPLHGIHTLDPHVLTEVGLDESSVLKIKVDSRIFSNAFFERTCNMQHELAFIDGASATNNGLKTRFLGLVELLHARIVWSSFIRMILARQPAPRPEDILFSGAV